MSCLSMPARSPYLLAAAPAMAVAAWLSFCSAASAQSVFRQPVGAGAGFRPTAIAAAPDGSVFVADQETETIQRYGASGELLSVFDSPVRGRNERITDLAVDSQGVLYATWSALRGGSPTGQQWQTANALTNAFSGVTSYLPSGQVATHREFGNRGLTSVTIGPDDRIFVGADRMIAEIDSNGQLAPLVENGLFSLTDVEYSPTDNKLYAVSAANTDVLAYELSGQLSHGFSAANPIYPRSGSRLSPLERVTAFAAADDGLWLTDSLSGSVRKYSLSGELLDIGYGVTRTEGLAVRPDGTLVAAMPQSQTVERIGAERFDPNYGGVTLLSETNRQRVSGPFALWNGLDVSNGWTESPAGTFLVPGEPGQMIDVSFHYVNRGQSVLRVFPVESLTADPAEQPAEYLRQAYEAAYTHLELEQPVCLIAPGIPACDGVDPTLIETLSIEAGTEIGFLHLRNQWDFRPYAGGGVWLTRNGEPFPPSVESATETFELLSQLSDEEYADAMSRWLEDPIASTSGLQPFASDSRANWGRIDQFAFFLSEDATFLAMEDLSQAGFSDLSYHDATLLIDVRLIPVPEPISVVMLLVGLVFSATAGSCPCSSNQPRRPSAAPAW